MNVHTPGGLYGGSDRTKRVMLRVQTNDLRVIHQTSCSHFVVFSLKYENMVRWEKQQQLFITSRLYVCRYTNTWGDLLQLHRGQAPPPPVSPVRPYFGNKYVKRQIILWSCLSYTDNKMIIQVAVCCWTFWFGVTVLSGLCPSSHMTYITNTSWLARSR